MGEYFGMVMDSQTGEFSVAETDGNTNELYPYKTIDAKTYFVEFGYLSVVTDKIEELRAT